MVSRFDGASTSSFVPLLVRRYARENFTNTSGGSRTFGTTLCQGLVESARKASSASERLS